MLKTLNFSNYKAFDNAKINLKPITIILGANSSGKSSLLQLLLMIKQTTNLEEGYESALKLNGKFVNLGEVENIFRNKNISKEISLSFTIQPENRRQFFIQRELKRYRNRVENDISQTYLQLKKIESIKEAATSLTSLIQWRSFSQKATEKEVEVDFLVKEIKRLKRKLKKNPDYFSELGSNQKHKKLFASSVGLGDSEINDLLSTDINEYLHTHQLLDSISKEKLNQFTIEYNFIYSQQNSNIEISKISIRRKDANILAFCIEKNKGHRKYLLQSDIFSNKTLDKYRVSFGKNVSFHTLELASKSDINENLQFKRLTIDNEYFATHVLRFFSLFSIEFGRTFSPTKINYVSPLRAYPKRYYFLDESNVSNSLDSIDGDNLTGILKKEFKVVNKVNKWLNKFGLSVGVEDVKEVIHRLKVNQNGLSLDITDVGFGISQVLPIIVQGFLSKNESLTIIEQPEIHLHPMMQAELADLFIDVIKFENQKSDKTLLIETHSEAILKRLRRRIAEGKISHDDVAIYFVHGRNKKSLSAKIEHLGITKTGAFDWPKEFYSTDYEDTTEFLKLQ